VDPAPARITVARMHPDDVKDRQIVVSSTAAHRHPHVYRSVTRKVAPGPHRLKAHNTLFWKNLEVDLQPGEHAAFRSQSRRNRHSVAARTPRRQPLFLV
jgi:hypothetical protein